MRYFVPELLLRSHDIFCRMLQVLMVIGTIPKRLDLVLIVVVSSISLWNCIVGWMGSLVTNKR